MSETNIVQLGTFLNDRLLSAKGHTSPPQRSAFLRCNTSHPLGDTPVTCSNNLPIFYAWWQSSRFLCIESSHRPQISHTLCSGNISIIWNTISWGFRNSLKTIGNPRMVLREETNKNKSWFKWFISLLLIVLFESPHFIRNMKYQLSHRTSWAIS